VYENTRSNNNVIHTVVLLILRENVKGKSIANMHRVYTWILKI
jgi:hypothetical protein